MAKQEEAKIFLIVGTYGLLSLKKHIEYFKEEHNVVFYNLVDKSKKTESFIERREKVFEKVVFCNLGSDISIAKAVRDFSDRVVAIETLSDKNITFLRKVVPFCPYANNSSESSLAWSDDKFMMRRFFSVFDKSITPKFVILKKDADPEDEALRIESKLDYPVMVKPSNLASSKLVSKNYHREELVKSIKRVFKKTKSVQRERYQSSQGKDEFNVVAEEFMEGSMYSVDGVVNHAGKVTCYPPCYVITGKNKGYDDFFAHTTRLPSRLSKKSIGKVNFVVESAVHALRLTNTHFHIELIRTEEGFKVIEISPRLGGFRRFMYEKAYGIDIFKNSLLNKLKKKVAVSSKVLEHVAVLKVYPKQEGKITKILGKAKVLKLESFQKLVQKAKKGDSVKFAKNGGDSVFTVYLSHPERGVLLGDVRRVEEFFEIHTEK